MPNPFNPLDATINIKVRGQNTPKEYMPAVTRARWLRSVHPDARMHTEYLRLDADLAVCQAHITIPSTGAEATGTGSEYSARFEDFIEKAESRSIGRACVLLGFSLEDALEEFTEVPLISQPAAPPMPTEVDDRAQYPKAWALVLTDFSYATKPNIGMTADYANGLRQAMHAGGYSACNFLKSLYITESAAAAAGTLGAEPRLRRHLEELPVTLVETIRKYLAKEETAAAKPPTKAEQAAARATHGAPVTAAA